MRFLKILKTNQLNSKTSEYIPLTQVCFCQVLSQWSLMFLYYVKLNRKKIWNSLRLFTRTFPKDTFIAQIKKQKEGGGVKIWVMLQWWTFYLSVLSHLQFTFEYKSETGLRVPCRNGTISFKKNSFEAG